MWKSFYLLVIVLVIIVLISIIIRPFVNRKRENLIYQMVNDISSILGPKVYSDFGTLLGAYRDGGVIKDDMDGDLAILRSDVDDCYRMLQKSLNPDKYILDRDPLKLKVWVRGTCVGCDIAIYNIDPTKTVLTRQSFTIPYAKVFPLKQITWGQKYLPINIPNDPEWYLEYQYGPTWKVPRPGDKGREAADQKKMNYSWLYGWVYKSLASLAGLPLLLKNV